MVKMLRIESCFHCRHHFQHVFDGGICTLDPDNWFVIDDADASVDISPRCRLEDAPEAVHVQTAAVAGGLTSELE